MYFIVICSAKLLTFPFVTKKNCSKKYKNYVKSILFDISPIPTTISNMI